jgi:hypothetical protein
MSLNRKTEHSMGKIAKFKLDTFNKIKTDTLDAEHKLDLVIDETTKI